MLSGVPAQLFNWPTDVKYVSLDFGFLTVMYRVDRGLYTVSVWENGPPKNRKFDSSLPR